MTRRILSYTLLFMSFMIAILSASYAATPTKPAATPPKQQTVTPLPTPIGRVVWVKGTFTATMANNENRTLQKKSIIYLHDILKTADKSEAEIVFTDATLMTFKEDSEFSVDKYVDKKKAGSGDFVSNITTGGFRTITGVIAKNSPDNYQVNTPVGTIGVRGTDYQAVLHHGSLFVRVFKGKPCLTNKPKDKTKKSKTVCLDKDHPYGEIENADTEPKVLKTMPDELSQILEIINASLAPFQQTIYYSPSGVTSSFCITR